MGEVVSFKQDDDEDLVWVCNCGCQTFRLRADGESECAACDTFSSGETGGWRLRLPDPEPDPERPTTAGTTSTTDLGSPEAAIRRVLKLADPKEMVALVTVHENRRIDTWVTDVESHHQKVWLKKRLRDAYRLMVRR